MSIIKIKLPLDYRPFIDPYMILTHTGNTCIIIRPYQYKYKVLTSWWLFTGVQIGNTKNIFDISVIGETDSPFTTNELWLFLYSSFKIK